LFLACVVLDWVSRFRHRQLREERKEEEVISAVMSEEGAVWWRRATIDAATFAVGYALGLGERRVGPTGGLEI
jgi:hypothetical protein